MNKFLNDIRSAENPISGNRKIINTIAVLFLGIALGTFSKFLDFRQTELPSVLMAIDGALDVHNFLGRFEIWVLIALCISIYGKSYTFINDDEVEINGKRYEIYRGYENGSRGNYGIKCKEK